MVPSVDERHAERAQAERRKMSDSFRHHRASREIILVPVPVAGPDYGRQHKPGRYPSNQREPWRPQRAIPDRGKGKVLVEFLRRVQKQDAEIREYMRPGRSSSPG
jgi:hypothetical protein